LGDEGKSVLMNSHILQEVELVCDRVAIMTHGTLRSLGGIEDLTAATRFGMLVIHVPQDQASTAITTLAELGEPVIDVAQSRESVPITLDVEDQAQIDACVDRLRVAGVSVVRLEIKRPSLEDLFLSIVR